MAAENEELNFVLHAKDRTARALNNVKQRTDRADRSARSLNDQFGKMKGLIGGLAAGAAFQQLGQHIVQTTAKVRGFRRETAKVMDVSGQEMSFVVSQAKAISDTFGKDYQQVIKAADAASERFGMSAQKALTKIEKGFMRGGTQADDFLKQITEYGALFKDAGFSADEFFGTVTKGAKSGAFSDKLPDAIKEFSQSIREQTKPTREALHEAFSEDFADSIVKNVRKGSMSAKEALIQIDEQIERTNPDVKEMQMLTADLFRGPGEDIGQDFLRNIKEATTALSDQKGEMSDLTEQQSKMLDLNKELSQSQVQFEKSTREFGNTFQDVWKNIQISFWNALNDINRGLQEIGADPEKGRKIEQSRARERIRETHGDVVKKTRSKKSEALKEEIGEIADIPKEDFAVDALKNKKQVIKSRMEKLRKKREDLKLDVKHHSGVLDMVAPGAVEKWFTGGTKDPVADKRNFGAKMEHLKILADQEGQDPASVSARLRIAMIKRMRAKGELQALKQGKTSLKSELEKLQAKDRAGDLKTDPSGEQLGGGVGEPQLESRAQTIRSQAPKSFKINIENLIREFDIQAETVDEGAEELESKVVSAVLRGLNNAQSADNNGGG